MCREREFYYIWLYADTVCVRVCLCAFYLLSLQISEFYWHNNIMTHSLTALHEHSHSKLQPCSYLFYTVYGHRMGIYLFLPTTLTTISFYWPAVFYIIFWPSSLLLYPSIFNPPPSYFHLFVSLSPSYIFFYQPPQTSTIQLFFPAGSILFLFLLSASAYIKPCVPNSNRLSNLSHNLHLLFQISLLSCIPWSDVFIRLYIHFFKNTSTTMKNLYIPI